MLRRAFREELQRIQDEVLSLGSRVENALLDSVEALRRRDLIKAQEIIDADRLINETRFAIEHDVLIILATQQPAASDLRTLAAVLEVITELERIGDYGKGISKISLMIGDQPLLKPLIDIPRMAEKAVSMIHRALTAFANRDVALALSIPKEDDEVDAMYNQVYRDLVAYIVADPSVLDHANYLMWVAHNIERAADRSTNLCERVVFMVTGRMSELDNHGEASAVDLGT
jgi:phosphate transport system protein